MKSNDLLEVLIEEAVHDGVGADGGHGEQVARGVDCQQHSVALGRLPTVAKFLFRYC